MPRYGGIVVAYLLDEACKGNTVNLILRDNQIFLTRKIIWFCGLPIVAHDQ
jgi:hypothetical protein